jgi:nitric oxide reductase large subunit
VPAAEAPAGSTGQARDPGEALEQDHAAFPHGPEGGRGSVNQRTLWKAFFVVVLLAVIGSLVWLAMWLNTAGGQDASAGAWPGV